MPEREGVARGGAHRRRTRSRTRARGCRARAACERAPGGTGRHRRSHPLRARAAVRARRRPPRPRPFPGQAARRGGGSRRAPPRLQRPRAGRAPAHSDAWTTKTTLVAANTIPRPQARVADVLRTPTARAAIAPGASTRPVAAASRTSRNSELIARSASARRPPGASALRRGTSRPAAPGRHDRGGRGRCAAASAPAPPLRLRDA